MLLNPEIGSIVKTFQSINKVPVYIDLIPKNFSVPSMYFPTPQTDSYRSSFSGFTKDYQIFVKVFDKSSLLAQNAAENITNNILENHSVIPIYNPDGTQSGYYLRIDKIVSRKIDEGVIQIEINWRSNRQFYKEKAEEIKNFYVDIKIGG